MLTLRGAIVVAVLAVVAGAGPVVLLLLHVLARLRQLEIHMDAQTSQLLDKIDAATNAVAGKLKTLADELQAAIDAGKTPDPALVARLQSHISTLEALGADKQNPVPPPVPEPVA